MGCHQQHSGAVGDERISLGQGKPSTSRSGFPQIKVPSKGKQVLKKLAARQGHVSQVRQQNHDSRAEIPFCFSPLLFSGCSVRAC